MALTREGVALTEAHRLAQLAVAARAERVSRSLWRRLDLADLDRSQSVWLPAQLALLSSSYRQSQDVAGEYVSAYRAVEATGPTGPFVAPLPDMAAMTTTALATGPWQVKVYIRDGLDPRSAKAAALSKFGGAVRREVLAGGRKAIDATTSADGQAIGWRRVSDGDPCTFCAMLVTRGPVYASAETATARAGEGLRYHSHCGCTAEIVYGEWIPNEDEQAYIDAYEAAAREATAVDGVRTEDTVLWRMRRDGPFHDSLARRRKTSDVEDAG